MQLPFEIDHSVETTKALGLIVLSADETIEREFREIFHRQAAALYHTRIESAPDVTPETLMLMKDRLTDAAGFLPGNTPLSVVGYACTSGATVIGADAVAAAVGRAHGSAKVTNPASAVVAALKHLNVTRVGVVSPYVEEVSNAVCALLRDNDLDPVRVGSFGQGEEAVVARIALGSVEDAICSVGSDPQVEAVFTSCTNLRTFPVIEACEKRLGKPVISSNLALAWHMMTLAGLGTAGQGPGRLFAG
ncbi:maleate cis-trans isomerase family protein [Roseibium sp. Sym1]|uniref:maleate cis-trans isomerase family protein n=1 Tax=Roseibium sp. Sym1 TaxID=3016006 RepID=UPI0022B2CE19|nr:Asp/Glu racemase [Roseibium sp. Sym1]